MLGEDQSAAGYFKAFYQEYKKSQWISTASINEFVFYGNNLVTRPHCQYLCESIRMPLQTVPPPSALSTGWKLRSAAAKFFQQRKLCINSKTRKQETLTDSDWLMRKWLTTERLGSAVVKIHKQTMAGQKVLSISNTNTSGSNIQPYGHIPFTHKPMVKSPFVLT